MPPEIRKAGSVALLTTIFTGLLTTLLVSATLYAVPKVISIDPLAKSVNALTKQIQDNRESDDARFDKITEVITQTAASMALGAYRLDAVEKDCAVALDNAIAINNMTPIIERNALHIEVVGMKCDVVEDEVKEIHNIVGKEENGWGY